MQFKYIKFKGEKLNPESFGGREPDYNEVLQLYQQRRLQTDVKDYTSIKISGRLPSGESFEETIWLSKEVYSHASSVLAPKQVFYEAHEGVTFTAAKGAWLIVSEPQPVTPPPGVTGECVRVQTDLGKELGLDPFIIEKEFVFKGFKGEDVEVGYVKNFRYFIAAYDVNGKPLPESRLRNTLLWRNYLSKEKVINTLGGVSNFLKRELWHLERMGREAFAKYKVVWRDVAKEFIPAIVTDGAVPDYTVNYVVVNSLDEACYLLAILLAPQVNAVVRELSPWIGHVQPRFIRYFKIPKYDPANNIHKQLAQIGKSIYNSRGEISQEDLKKIKELVEKL